MPDIMTESSPPGGGSTERRYHGRVKWYDPVKRIGFILPSDPGVNGGRDVFVHITAVKQAGYHSLVEGEDVEFCIEDFRGKPQAAALKKISAKQGGVTNHA